MNAVSPLPPFRHLSVHILSFDWLGPDPMSNNKEMINIDATIAANPRFRRFPRRRVRFNHCRRRRMIRSWLAIRLKIACEATLTILRLPSGVMSTADERQRFAWQSQRSTRVSVRRLKVAKRGLSATPITYNPLRDNTNCGHKQENCGCIAWYTRPSANTC